MLGVATCSFINTEPGALRELPARNLSALYGSRDGGLATVYRRVCICGVLDNSGRSSFSTSSVKLPGQTIHWPLCVTVPGRVYFCPGERMGAEGLHPYPSPPGELGLEGWAVTSKASRLGATAAAAVVSLPKG